MDTKGCVIMCDIDKYKSIFKLIKELEPEDTLQLVLESDSEDECEFFELVGDFILQKRQREVIEAKKF